MARDSVQRRTDFVLPESSLILLKPTMQVPHGGGRRIEKGSVEYQTMLAWVKAHAPKPAATDPEVTKLHLYPPRRVGQTGLKQQLRVEAEYAGGKVTTTDGTWLAGVDGALPGYIMMAAPKVGDAYRQEYRPGIAEDFAKVVKTDATAGGPSGQYTNVVVTEDTDLLDKAKFEHKWFAPGVGSVGTDGMVGGHHEIRTLVAILAGQ